MTKFTQGNDEIHHFEGKNPMGSCRVINNSFTEESEAPPPILQSNLISKAPPGVMYLHTFEEQNIVKRLINKIFSFCKESDYQVKHVHYFIENLPIETIKDLSNNNTRSYMIQNINALCCIVTTTNIYGSNQPRKEYREAETTAYEEVTPEHKQDETPVSKPSGTIKDYSKSVLVPFLTYPDNADYFIDWLHRSMENQSKVKDYLLPLRAATEKGLFKTPIPYKVFQEEFGDKVSQTWYSKLMGSNDIYSEDEFTLVLESLNMELFE